MKLKVDLTEMTSDLPLPTLRMLDDARAGQRSTAAAAGRDHRGAPVGPRREGLHRHARVARTRPLGAVHLPPPGRGECHLRPRQRAPRRPHGRHARPARGRGGEDRRADAGRAPSSPPRSRPRCARPRPGVGSRRRKAPRGRTSSSATTPTACSNCAPARSSASPRGTCCSTLSPATARRRAERCWWAASRLPPPPVRGDPGRRRARARRPHARAAPAAADPREHRHAALQPHLALGPDQPRRRDPPRAERDRAPVDRHARPASSAPAVGGNQQKLTLARWLAAGFTTMLLRPHADRRRHQAPDLRAAARARRRRCRDTALHLRAAGDPARLRPDGRRLPRQGDRRDARRRGRRARAAAAPTASARWAAATTVEGTGAAPRRGFDWRRFATRHGGRSASTSCSRC